tara:strand:+ start:3032 stop:3268 length:237 start_codon:yes stop_codon:yes gene_type:complete
MFDPVEQIIWIERQVQVNRVAWYFGIGISFAPDLANVEGSIGSRENNSLAIVSRFPIRVLPFTIWFASEGFGIVALDL